MCNVSTATPSTALAKVQVALWWDLVFLIKHICPSTSFRENYIFQNTTHPNVELCFGPPNPAVFLVEGTMLNLEFTVHPN